MGHALLLVDVQKNMLEGVNPVPGAEHLRPVLQSLLHAARKANTVVVHVQNNGESDEPDAPGTPGWDLVFTPNETELVIQKTQGDAFYDSGLAAWLRAHQVDEVVIAGMQSEFCIRDTARGALANGFGVILVSDAHATYGASPRDASQIARSVEEELAQKCVRIVGADQVGF